jgi:uncharacterized protein with FMN-binding domain
MNQRRSPSRIPVRGAIGVVLTVGGMALLLSFRGPDAPVGDIARALTDEPGDLGASDELMPTAMPAASDLAATPMPAATDLAPPLTATEPTDKTLPQTEAVAVTAVGESISIRWGDVQVAVTAAGDDIIEVEALALPVNDRRSLSISRGAEPVLREQAVAIDCADVDVVSGATYTSLAYAASLQSALDQLGI